MHDYTDYAKMAQYNAVVDQLHKLNNHMNKISKRLTVLTLIAVGVTAYKVRELKRVKGE